MIQTFGWNAVIYHVLPRISAFLSLPELRFRIPPLSLFQTNTKNQLLTFPVLVHRLLNFRARMSMQRATMLMAIYDLAKTGEYFKLRGGLSYWPFGFGFSVFGNCGQLHDNECEILFRAIYPVGFMHINLGPFSFFFNCVRDLSALCNMWHNSERLSSANKKYLCAAEIMVRTIK